jgi:hypothetical protein
VAVEPGGAAALAGGCLEGRRPWVAAAWGRLAGGGGLEWRLPGGGGPGVAAALGGGGPERRRPEGGGLEAPELGLAEAKKLSGSDYHVRGDGLQWNWMPVLLNGGYNI